MINTLLHDEDTPPINTLSLNEELLTMMQLEGKKFSWELDFTDPDYNVRREIFEDFADELTDALYETPFTQSNVLWNLISEIVKNSADHSHSRSTIVLKVIPAPHKLLIQFSVQDEGEGLPFELEELTKIFDTIKWEILENLNRGIGLNRIKAAAELLGCDLILHHKGTVYHVHTLGLQENVLPQDSFGYEGVAVFDLIK